jgi:hypothetical protein
VTIMGIASVRNRVSRLERILTPVVYAPLTKAEIEDILNERSGNVPSADMARRIEAQGTIIDGWNRISAYRGQITVKRILGIDPSLAW